MSDMKGTTQSDSSSRKHPHSYLRHLTGNEEHDEPRGIETLSAALGVGIFLVKSAIFVLALAFLVSNVFWVPEGSVAIQRRLGKIVDLRTDPVRRPGGPYVAFPYPIDNVMRVPTTIQHITIDRPFWYGEYDSIRGTHLRSSSENSLTPGDHGSLVTADKNLVQGIWAVHYRVDHTATGASPGVVDFVRNVGSLAAGQRLVASLAEKAIVMVVARTTVSDFVAGSIDHGRIRDIVQEELTALATGIRVTNVSSTKYRVPSGLLEDFQAVTEAESQKALEIERAARYRVSTLSELAGEDWETLLKAVSHYERVAGSGTDEARALEEVYQLLLSGSIGGDVAQRLDSARTDKTLTIERSRAAATRFNELLPAYRRDRSILKAQLVQDVLREIWADPSVNTHYVPNDKRMYLDIEN